MKLSIKQGSNRFKINGILPIQFNVPRWKDELTYSIKLHENWLGDFELSDPAGYGVKLPGLGHWWDYHINGFGFALGKVDGKTYIHPRYYEHGTLHELVQYRTLVGIGEETRLVLKYSNGLIEWLVFGLEELWWCEAVRMPQLFINNYTPFLGTHGNIHTPDGAVASRDLSMEIKF